LDVLNGGAGNDIIYSRDDGIRDQIDGGAGTADYAIIDRTSFSGKITLDLSNPSVSQELGDITTLINVERVAFYSGSGDDHLTGGALDDTLLGGAGNDTLNGGAGNDTLTGGPGQDYYLFGTALNALNNVDHVTDFNVADDKIELDHLIFSTLPIGTLADAAFYIGATAHDANDRIIYDPSTGALYYDADGNGAGAATEFAVVASNLNMTHTQFLVV
jgi:serralysin